MAFQNIIAKGVGFSPGDTHFIVTHGFSSGTAPIGTSTPIAAFANNRIGSLILILFTSWRLPEWLTRQ